jgi:hypothetical protein
LRASAPIMPNSCLRGSSVAAVTWVHQIAYQLTVTRRGWIPEPEDRLPMSGN